MGLSPAAIVLIILNFFGFFIEIPFVSLAITAKPSNAVLLCVGLTEGDLMSESQILFTEFKTEIF